MRNFSTEKDFITDEEMRVVSKAVEDEEITGGKLLIPIQNQQRQIAEVAKMSQIRKHMMRKTMGKKRRR